MPDILPREPALQFLLVQITPVSPALQQCLDRGQHRQVPDVYALARSARNSVCWRGAHLLRLARLAGRPVVGGPAV